MKTLSNTVVSAPLELAQMIKRQATGAMSSATEASEGTVAYCAATVC